jgi:hypothetical protein
MGDCQVCEKSTPKVAQLIFFVKMFCIAFAVEKVDQKFGLLL